MIIYEILVVLQGKFQCTFNAMIMNKAILL